MTDKIGSAGTLILIQHCINDSMKRSPLDPKDVQQAIGEKKADVHHSFTLPSFMWETTILHYLLEHGSVQCIDVLLHSTSGSLLIDFTIRDLGSTPALHVLCSRKEKMEETAHILDMILNRRRIPQDHHCFTTMQSHSEAPPEDCKNDRDFISLTIQNWKGLNFLSLAVQKNYFSAFWKVLQKQTPERISDLADGKPIPITVPISLSDLKQLSMEDRARMEFRKGCSDSTARLQFLLKTYGVQWSVHDEMHEEDHLVDGAVTVAAAVQECVAAYADVCADWPGIHEPMLARVLREGSLVCVAASLDTPCRLVMTGILVTALCQRIDDGEMAEVMRLVMDRLQGRHFRDTEVDISSLLHSAARYGFLSVVWPKIRLRLHLTRDAPKNQLFPEEVWAFDRERVEQWCADQRFEPPVFLSTAENIAGDKHKANKQEVQRDTKKNPFDNNNGDMDDEGTRRNALKQQQRPKEECTATLCRYLCHHIFRPLPSSSSASAPLVTPAESHDVRGLHRQNPPKDKEEVENGVPHEEHDLDARQEEERLVPRERSSSSSALAGAVPLADAVDGNTAQSLAASPYETTPAHTMVTLLNDSTAPDSASSSFPLEPRRDGERGRRNMEAVATAMVGKLVKEGADVQYRNQWMVLDQKNNCDRSEKADTLLHRLVRSGCVGAVVAALDGTARPIDFTQTSGPTRETVLHAICTVPNVKIAERLLECIVARLEAHPEDLYDFGQKTAREDDGSGHLDFISLAAKHERLFFFWNKVKEMPYYADFTKRIPLTAPVAEDDWRRLSREDRDGFQRVRSQFRGQIEDSDEYSSDYSDTM